MTQLKSKRVVVIGGGFSGLASAALLAKQGYQVTLLEKNEQLGGRARVLKTKGFSFDMGPSWYLMPEVFTDFFALFNKKPEDYYQLVRLDPRYQVFFGNQKKLDTSKSLAKTTESNLKIDDSVNANQKCNSSRSTNHNLNSKLELDSIPSELSTRSNPSKTDINSSLCSSYYPSLGSSPSNTNQLTSNTQLSSVILDDNLEQNKFWFEEQETGAGQKLERFLDKMKQIYELSTQELMYADLNYWRTWIKPTNWLVVSKLLVKFKFWQSWAREVGRYFSNPKLKKVLGFPAVFLGGSPFNTPALYSILAWADFGQGVWYPLGGMGQLVKSLADLAKEQGVKIITNQEVSGLEIQDGQIKAVYTRDHRIEADLIVGAADLPWLETNLIPTDNQSYDLNYWQQRTMSISALLLYLGLDKKVKNLVHHNIYFADDWETNFNQIFEQKKLPDDPSLYISVRTATDQSIAPPGSEELFVLVPLGAGGDYKPEQLEQYAQRIIARVEQLAGESLEPHLVVKKLFTPQDFARDYNAFQGTALGLAHTLDQSLWFRPNNRSRKIKNLYYAGQYTNPGVGVPMALISAQITAEMIKRDYPTDGDFVNKKKIGSKSQLENQDQLNNQVFKQGSTTYYYSSLFFRGQVKADVFSLYAYVRIIDDLVDVSIPKKEEFEQLWQLTKKWWNQDLELSNLLEQAKTDHQRITASFIELAKRRKFDWQWIEAFWQSMSQDIDKKFYHSQQELFDYIYGSAEVIGLMMAQILELPAEAAESAQMQGRAMQFINFVRDVEEDQELGRNYLGYSQETKQDPTRWAEFVRGLVNQYRQMQQLAEEGYDLIPRRYLVPIKTAAEIYSWTADQIERDPSIVWEKKVKPSKLRVIGLILKNSLAIWVKRVLGHKFNF
ncbi:MAG: phytoene desaturase [Candidatus Pacebacteria bacterium]|nr:phytoene desaturase [Candidatus Paceibacterota bacterium]